MKNSRYYILSFLFTLISLGLKAQTINYDLIIIFKPTATVANINAIKTALNATQIDSTGPSRALLWRCSSTVGSTITIPAFAGGTVTSALIVPTSTGSEAVGVICSSGQSEGVGLNGVYIVPESDLPREQGGAAGGLYSGCTGTPIDSVARCPSGRRAVKMAIMDSGIDCKVVNEQIVITHDTLRPFVCYRTTNEKLNNIDDDANGYKDDFIGYDFVNNDGVPEDSTGHGTFVSGVVTRILKRNNGGEIKYLVLKVLNGSNRGFEYNFIKALDYAIKQKVEVINCSFVSSDILMDTMLPFTEAIYTARNSGMIVSLAAGNRTRNIDSLWYSPPSFQNENIITTGATVCMDSVASFSNFGKRNVDIAAPSKNIISTWLNNLFAIHSGTSYAAPQSTAIAGLLASNQTTYDWRKVKCAILYGSSFRSFLDKQNRRSGILNGVGAFNLLATAPYPCDGIISNIPSVSGDVLAFNAYPNPFDNALNLTLYLEKNTHLDIKVFNELGQIMSSTKTYMLSGKNDYPLSIDAPKGIYFVQIQTENGRGVKKIVKF